MSRSEEEKVLLFQNRPVYPGSICHIQGRREPEPHQYINSNLITLHSLYYVRRRLSTEDIPAYSQRTGEREGTDPLLPSLVDRTRVPTFEVQLLPSRWMIRTVVDEWTLSLLGTEFWDIKPHRNNVVKSNVHCLFWGKSRFEGGTSVDPSSKMEETPIRGSDLSVSLDRL